MDDLIHKTQARQRSASPFKPRGANKKAQDDLPEVSSPLSEETGSTRRRKKRGRGSQEQQEEREDVPSPGDGENGERGTADA